MSSAKTETAIPIKIAYTLSFPEAQAHYMDVEMEISGLAQPTIDLRMPVWTPGSYLIREYAKNVEQFTAEAGSTLLSVKKTSKNTWQITTAGIAVVNVKYRLYCFEVSVRTSFINTAHAFINSPGTFMYPAGMLNEPSTIRIKPYQGWTTVSSGLEMRDNDPFILQVPNYDILFDSPIEVGNQDVFEFDAAGVKYEVAMVGGGNYDKGQLTTDLTKIIAEETAIFGENPNHRYVFIVHNYLKGSGGLEHLSSTVLGATRDAYNTEPAYQRFLALAAHEHFHLWNVKRLRPFALGPFDYEKENYTTELWIAEGFTAYFDNMVVHRTGLYPLENYLEAMAGDINHIENQPGINVQPLADASFDAWIKFYRPNENSVNSTISYYTKGAVLALLLDLEIINNSQTRHSLDDVMKYAYQEYYKNQNRGYTDTEFKQALEKFTGKALDDFYARYVYGLDAINYHQYLDYAGFALVDDLAQNHSPALGITTVSTNGKIMVTSVLRGSSAWIDGLNVNDELVAINGNPITNTTNLLDGFSVAETVTLSVMRDGLPMDLNLRLLKNNQVKYKLASISNPTDQQLNVRKKWLRLSEP